MPNENPSFEEQEQNIGTEASHEVAEETIEQDAFLSEQSDIIEGMMAEFDWLDLPMKQTFSLRISNIADDHYPETNIEGTTWSLKSGDIVGQMTTLKFYYPEGESKKEIHFRSIEEAQEYFQKEIVQLEIRISNWLPIVNDVQQKAVFDYPNNNHETHNFNEHGYTRSQSNKILQEFTNGAIGKLALNLNKKELYNKILGKLDLLASIKQSTSN